MCAVSKIFNGVSPINLLGIMQSGAKTVIHTTPNGATNKHVGPAV